MDFTSEQSAVIEFEKGCVVVIAGAGSGKTRCLVERTARLVDVGYTPSGILLFTFTRKAADEIKERIAHRLEQDPADLSVCTSTIHSLALRIFRENKDLLGYDTNPTIWDPMRRGKLLKSAVKAFLESKKSFDGEADCYTTVKNEDIPELEKELFEQAKIAIDRDEYKPYPEKIGLTAMAYYNKVLALEQQINFDEDSAIAIATILAEYKKTKDFCSAIEFDDMIPAAIKILNIGCSYNYLFEHIMIDEYQDVNQVNVDFVKALRGDQTISVMAVGDDDQSIYGFRGGNVQHILDFPKVFDGSSLFLTKNFRSTPEIVAIANRVISNNTTRYPKVMTAFRNSPCEHSDGIITHTPYSSNDFQEKFCSTQFQQYEDVYWYIRGLIKFVECKPGDIAVLARNNMNLRLANSVFKRCAVRDGLSSEIPFDISALRSPFQRAAVKRIISTANMLLNPKDIVTARETLMANEAGFGGKTAEYLSVAAQNDPEGNVVKWLLDLSSFPRHGEKTKKYQSIKSIAERICTSLELLETSDIKEFWKIASNTSNTPLFIQYKQDTHSQKHRRTVAEGDADQEAMDEASEIIEAFVDKLPEEDRCNHQLLLDHIATEISTAESRDDGVQLMTIHGSKGKEWPIVFLIDLVEKTLPSSRGDDIEEERRLFYVGITRAKDEVHFSYYEQDPDYEAVEASSFWKELGIKNRN